MSFGFSVGDIILLGQISYRLYTSLTTGRKAASKDLKELSDVLFSLNCALDRLGKTATDISSRASKQPSVDGETANGKLGKVISTCAATLAELEEATRKYREAEANSQDGGSQTSTSSSSLQRFRQRFKSQLNRISWDLNGESISAYRQKLQLHTDSINIILTTFVWSATDRIENDGKKWTQKLQELQDQTTHSNTQLLDLLRDVHSMLRVPTSTAFAATVSMHQTAAQPPGGNLCIGESNATPQYGSRNTPKLVSRSLQVDNNRMPMNSYQRATGISAHADPPASQLEPSSPLKTPEPCLFPSIENINKKRRIIGSKEFVAFGHKFSALHKAPSMAQLQEGIHEIFDQTAVSAMGRTVVNPTTKKAKVIHWVDQLDTFLNSWTSDQTFGSRGRKSSSSSADLINLLVYMNYQIEQCGDELKGIFYRGAKDAGFDRILEKLQTYSKSVRCCKEIEEYKDTREEWEGISGSQ
ncbi:hypothetical protein MGYG_08214 [Nannizzia gypsea CBS 118893]|uniref:Fungal N-terminal domain-containing protein n=1 Tax=Arthroderma gypseum (strain ATCC MYA-4604 / CBS 118893) TaxID=535722 RepID=E4V5C6_ARTGP|nr:hypothetical protein MGYG_08214 [Nannizzia gypsea CBS 118893]EFR05200.1 hypothetical protein MGYG_08214 [Nannizzia gypsea CBS 118893]